MSERTAVDPGRAGRPDAPEAAGSAASGVAGRARSLADELRRWDDSALVTLLRLRPDLMHPVPNDVAALAARATTTASTGRALDGLDRWTLQVAEVVAALPLLPEPGAASVVTEAEVRAALPGVDPDRVTTALDRLAALALLWRDASPASGRDRKAAAPGVYLTRTVRDLLGPYPCNLAAPSQGRVRLARYERTGLDPAVLADAPPGALELLERLAWSTPVGQVANADRRVSVESARTPVEWLLARDLLVADDAETVVLPRPVALHLRGGRLVAEPQPEAPELTGPVRDAGVVDRTAGLHALTIVRQVDDLLEAWSVDPPDRLRAGGLGVRATAAAGATIDTDPATAVLVVELAAAAGLLADDGEVWLPTPAFDVWRGWGTQAQWAHLAAVWLATTRVPSLVGTRNPGLVNALTQEAARSGAPAVRLEVLDELAAAPFGTVVDAPALLRRLDWRSPRRTGELRSALATATLREAELLGLTGLGALASTGRALLALARSEPGPHVPHLPARGRLDPPPAVLAAAVGPWLPEPVRHVLLQADLTAVAPGPLEPELARRLAVVADVESSGAGAVYRFTDSSVRRGLDAGLGRADILDLLATLSATGVPQPLEYLVADVARRHGGIRVGTASAYIRSDDVAALSELLADRRVAGLNPARLAPTVVVVSAPIDEVLSTLRAAGYAPAAESADGRVVVRRKDSRRAPGTGFSIEAPRSPGTPTATLVDAAVRALRAGERAARERTDAEVAVAGAGTGAGAGAAPAPTSTLPRNTTAETMTALRVALHAQVAIRIGYADTHGTSTERIVDPLQLQSGILTAYDHRAAEVRNFAVTRITGVEFIEESA